MHGALEQLRELDRLKDEFIAVVSHELRTPLASVYGAAMTLQRHTLDATRARRCWRSSTASRPGWPGSSTRCCGPAASRPAAPTWLSSRIDGVRAGERRRDAVRAHVPASSMLEVSHSPGTSPVAPTSTRSSRCS